MRQMRKQGCVQKNMPIFSYLIEHLIMFQHRGTWHLLVIFDNKSVQAFDYATGTSIFEFNFNLRPQPDLPEDPDMRRKSSSKGASVSEKLTRRESKVSTRKSAQQHTQLHTMRSLTTPREQLKRLSSAEAKPRRHAVLGVENPFPVKKSFDLPQEQPQLVGAKLDRNRNQLTELKRFFR
jgi:hypothetical protein